METVDIAKVKKNCVWCKIQKYQNNKLQYAECTNPKKHTDVKAYQ